ncbi:VWA domain-containing protein [Edaphobacter paludis]|uniref:VWA domain-containing protein n=1 Tax=Edaphobacter paludis TaxID=3035702 RepID=A0AAU7D8W7_9BACT
MPSMPMRAVLSVAALLCIAALPLAQSQSTPSQKQPAASDAPTLHVTSRLVFLDVTVLNAKGHPVVSGLTKDDFTITQDKKPQRIFSFEAPEAHVVTADAADDNPAGSAPVTIFVIDQLNSTFEQMAYIRYCVHKYLAKEPKQLKAPAEVMVMGNESLEMVQGYTRDKKELLSAVDHIPTVIPYKMNGSFFSERFVQSIYALQEIALENHGVPGRKNIVWIGHGGPSLYTASLDSKIVDEVNAHVHRTVNMLVDSRMSLFLIYPGLEVRSRLGTPISAMSAELEIGDDDPFSGDINFGVFVNETGGKLFYNRNDLDQLIRTSVELGSRYYTLTYQPPEGVADGKFRRVRVTMRNPALHALTKAGYFAPDKTAPADPRANILYNIAEAAQADVPFQGVGLTVEKVIRHRDTNSADITVNLNTKNLGWQAAADGKNTADIGFVAASLSARRDVLASKTEDLRLINNSSNPVRTEKPHAHLTMTLRVPRRTKSVRLVIGSLADGRMGAVELDRKAIDAAPDMPTPQPKLIPQPAKQLPSP